MFSFSLVALEDVPDGFIVCGSIIGMFLLSAYITLLFDRVLCICRTFSVIIADGGAAADDETCWCIVKWGTKPDPADDMPLLLLGTIMMDCTDGEMVAVGMVGAVSDDGEVMLFHGNDCCLSSSSRIY